MVPHTNKNKRLRLPSPLTYPIIHYIRLTETFLSSPAIAFCASTRDNLISGIEPLKDRAQRRQQRVGVKNINLYIAAYIILGIVI